MKGSCILIPEISGEDSILYKEILEKNKTDRPFVNLIYALYLQPGVQAQMDANGYKRNKQGQHKYKDVIKFLDIDEFKKQREVSLQTEAIDLGIMNPNLSYVDFTNVDEAFDKAQQYNSSHDARIAYVVQHGNAYNVILINKDSRTIKHLYNFNKQAVTWEAFKSKVRESGVNLDDLLSRAGGMLTPINVENFLNTVDIFKSASNDVLGIKDISILFTLGESLPRVQALMNRGWGTFDEVVQKCYDAIQNPSTVSPSTLNLINSTINDCKLHSPFNASSVLKHIQDNVIFNFDITSEEKNIQDTIKDLEDNYQINRNTISKKINEINSLEDVALEAITILEKEIRRLESEKGVTKTVKELEKTKQLLAEELSSKRTYFGITQFLEQALKYALKTRDIIMNIPVGGTNQEYLRACAAALSTANNLRNAYYNILTSLCNMDVFIINENLTSADKDLLQTKAKEVKSLLDEIENKITSHLRKEFIVKNLQEELGDSTEFGLDYVNIAEMLEQDTSVVDYIGQVAKSSNAILASVGTIVRNAQHQRDEKLDAISTRIGRATKKLYDTGYKDTEFMYDENNRIITEEGIDWEAYKEARNKAIKTFKKTFKYRGFALKEAIEIWEQQNTVEKIVDPKTGRTERIPDGSYRLSSDDNPFNKLSDAQKEYYREMMDIKGEIGTLLPKWAQQQFLPPQLRASTWDLIKRAKQEKWKASKLALMLLDRMKFWKIREDDTDYITSTQHGDYDNTPLRDIPIFYAHPLNNQDELLKDFSSALQSFASTALNYEAMANIKDKVEAIQSFTRDMSVKEDSEDVITYWDNIKQQVTYVFSILRKKSKQHRVSDILDAYLDKELYNIKRKGSKKVNKLMDALIGYNSVIRLSANVLGATANITAGVIQTVIEAGGGKYYNTKDLVQAQIQMLGPGKYTGAAWDILTGSKQNKFTLLHEFFDMAQDNYADKSRQRYHQNAGRRLFGKFNIMGMYSGGEFLIRSINGMAVLNHEKVKLNGKVISLSQAFEKTNDANSYPELKLKDGITKLDGSPLTLEDQYFKDVKKKIKACSDECFGAFSQEDKGVINQYCLGRLAMNFRQWMVEHYSRRYRTKHWDYTKKQFVEGYYITPFRLIRDILKAKKDGDTIVEAMKNTITEEDKYNLKKAGWETALFIALCAFNFGMGDVDDEDDYWTRFWMYNVKRMQSETGAAFPLGIFSESKKLIKTPIPAITTVNGLMYPITGIMAGDFMDEIERGRYEGWNKYGRNLLWYSVPFYKQVDQLIHMDEEDTVFIIFTDKGLQ